MAAVTDVTISAGAPTAGNGTVSTLDKFDSAIRTPASRALTVQGTEALVLHDAADSGSPYKQGFKATSSLSALTPVATADRTDGFAGTDGVQIVRTDTNLEDISVAFINCTSGANTSALAALGAGIRWWVKGVTIYNNGASNGALLLTDGSGGATKAKVPFPASTGTVVTFPLPVPFTAATAVYADPTGSDTIDVTIFGFKSKV
jgi:hypothetical protein